MPVGREAIFICNVEGLATYKVFKINYRQLFTVENYYNYSFVSVLLKYILWILN